MSWSRGRLRPKERRSRIGALQRRAVVSDLADQQAPRGQVGCALFQNAADEIQSIVPARERAPGLATVFRRKPAHACRSDVGRIADNQVVAPATEAGKQIGLN